MFGEALPLKCLQTLPLWLALASGPGVCGEGGGGPGAGEVATSLRVSAPAPGRDFLTEVTPPSYPPGSVETGAWKVLMAERATCGFGLLQQDSRIDMAAAAHASYLASNSAGRRMAIPSHLEDTAAPDFYGARPVDRLQRAGFPSGLGSYEIIAAGASLQGTTAPAPFTPNEALGAAAMRGLIETVYHMRGALTAGSSGGVGAKLAPGPYAVAGMPDGENFNRFAVVLDFSNEGTQKLGAGNIATYPCEGSTLIGGTFIPVTESPNPFPELTSAGTLYGTPIYFKADAGHTLVVNSATLVLASTQASLPYRKTTHANDPHGQLRPNEVFLTPVSALAKSSRYTVSAVGTLDGVAFAKTFTFATAP